MSNETDLVTMLSSMSMLLLLLLGDGDVTPPLLLLLAVEVGLAGGMYFLFIISVKTSIEDMAHLNYQKVNF